MGKIIGLDLGQKSLGIAISDELKIISIPVENFNFKHGDYAAALKRLQEIVEQDDVEKIILGYPLRTDGKKSDFTYIVEDFHQLLLDNINIEVKLQDERFSTQNGLEILGKTKEEAGDQKDMMAAYVILKDHLDTL